MYNEMDVERTTGTRKSVAWSFNEREDINIGSGVLHFNEEFRHKIVLPFEGPQTVYPRKAYAKPQCPGLT